MDEIDTKRENNETDQEKRKPKKNKTYHSRKFSISWLFYCKIYKVFKHKFSHFRGRLLPGSRETGKKENGGLGSTDGIKDT